MIALDRQQAVLSALVSALGADASLAALVGHRIYDVAPGRAVTPSITLKLVTAADASAADSEAQALTFDIDVWDRYALGLDLSHVRAVMGHVRRILHLQPLTVPGCTVVLLRCMAAMGPSRDPDGVTVQRFRLAERHGLPDFQDGLRRRALSDLPDRLSRRGLLPGQLRDHPARRVGPARQGDNVVADDRKRRRSGLDDGRAWLSALRLVQREGSATTSGDLV